MAFIMLFSTLEDRFDMASVVVFPTFKDGLHMTFIVILLFLEDRFSMVFVMIFPFLANWFFSFLQYFLFFFHCVFLIKYFSRAIASSLSCLLWLNKDSFKSSRKYKCQIGKFQKKYILKDCFLPGTNFSGVLPEEKDDEMLCCNNSMIIKIKMVVWIPLNHCCSNHIKTFPVHEKIK